MSLIFTPDPERLKQARMMQGAICDVKAQATLR